MACRAHRLSLRISVNPSTFFHPDVTLSLLLLPPQIATPAALSLLAGPLPMPFARVCNSCS
eukprot:m.267918 g.267918  ORF g.267918 m.267918 type:complete len:61 (-) comp34228_c0_seq1:519-701(-)